MMSQNYCEFFLKNMAIRMSKLKELLQQVMSIHSRYILNFEFSAILRRKIPKTKYDFKE